MAEINPNQLSTLREAARTAIQMEDICGGVQEIYNIPNWQNSPDFRHYLMGNGANGINAGLCRQTIENNPNSWEQMLTDDINSAVPKEEE
jgi:hypothetical protein